MLNFVPDSVLHLAIAAIIAAGASLYIAAFFFRLVLWLAPFREPARVIGTVLIVVGVYFYGGYSTEMSWRQRAEELQQKLARAEEQSREANVVIETKYVDRVRVIREHSDAVIRYIDREVVKYDVKFAPGGQCEIPREFIQAHN